MGRREPKHRSKKHQSYRFGILAEYWVIFRLVLKGYRILFRRYKTPVGEIDLIARKRDTLIFIEVKARRNEQTLHEVLTSHQQQRIRQAGNYFLARFPHLNGKDCRFDLATVGKRFRMEHHLDAW
ncbi:MAG: YraN family protein [Rickettsiales bacterium]|jgi:putative endonuclease|nr:YraN family protein [Rickettsiales bacterium]